MRAIPSFALIPPQSPVGNITVMVCPVVGTRLRVALFDLMVDIQVKRLAQHYQIITGPLQDGYLVTFRLRTEDTYPMYVFRFFLTGSRA